MGHILTKLDNQMNIYNTGICIRLFLALTYKLLFFVRKLRCIVCVASIDSFNQPLRIKR